MPDSLDVSWLLEEHELPSRYVTHLREDRGITELWKPQIEAINEGLLEGNNFLMTAKPGTGKTLAAEIAIVSNYRSNPGGCSLFLVPYRPLVEEKREEFSQTIGDTFNLDIQSASGSEEYDPSELFEADIVVMTFEKFDFYLRNHPEYLSEVSCAVFDEFHTLGDDTRGPRLEVVLTKMLRNHSPTQILGLSATAPNCDDLSDWVGGNHSDSGNWRMIPLYEGIYLDEADRGEIEFFEDGESVDTNDFPRRFEDPKKNAIVHYLSTTDPTESGRERRAMVFAPKRDRTEEIAKMLADHIRDDWSSTDIEIDEVASDALSDRINEEATSSGESVQNLVESAKYGVAFHHAGLSQDLKNIVEDGFEEGAARVLVATSSLAAGINLPVDRVFIDKPRVGGSGEYGRDLTVGEYKNLAGRAGRPGYTEKGESVLFAQNFFEKDGLKNQYVNETPEDIESEIDPTDANILLDLIRECESPEGICDFLSDSFYGYHEFDRDETVEDIESAVESLAQIGMAEEIESSESGEQFQLTPLGTSTSKRLISPNTVAAAVAYLRNLDSSNQFDLTAFFTGIAMTSEFEMCRLYRWSNPPETSLEEIRQLLPWDAPDDNALNHGLATGEVLAAWTSGEEVSTAIDRYQIVDSRTESDVRERLAPTTARVVKDLEQILSNSDNDLDEEFGDLLSDLYYRTRYGVNEDGVGFVKNRVVTDRDRIIDFQTRLGIQHPQEIAEGNVFRLFGNMSSSEAYTFTRRAINAYCEGAEKEKKHLLLDARDAGVDRQAYKELLSSSETEFEEYCFERLEAVDDFYVERFDESGHQRFAEGKIRIKDGTGSYIEEDGTPVEIAIECKSKQDLENDVVGANDATDIVRKTSISRKVTIGAPDFGEHAGPDAESQGVLLLPSAAFATFVLAAETGNIDPSGYLQLFDEIGYCSRDDVREIFGLMRN